VIKGDTPLVMSVSIYLHNRTCTIGTHVSLLSQKQMSSVFLVTEILVIEDYKLDNTFFHVAFGSQSFLKSTSD
jgi:hypothetical protein